MSANWQKKVTSRLDLATLTFEELGTLPPCVVAILRHTVPLDSRWHDAEAAKQGRKVYPGFGYNTALIMAYSDRRLGKGLGPSWIMACPMMHMAGIPRLGADTENSHRPFCKGLGA